MEKRKNQNSILFVATLGVYLGLVLAGATPQVMAVQRGAMTRNFDISDEIEFKDDLDNKPDDDRSSLNDSVGVYLQDVEQLIAALGSLNTDGGTVIMSNNMELEVSRRKKDQFLSTIKESFKY